MAKKFEKLIVFDNIALTPQQKASLMDCAKEIEFHPKTDDQKAVKEIIKNADAVINCWTVITEEALKGSKVGYIGNWGQWWKHRITVSEERLAEMGIHIDFIPDYGTDSVAEAVWAAVLSLSRNLEKWHKEAAAGKFTYENIKRGEKKIDIHSIEERLVKDKVLGIVGMGRIGSRVASIGLHGFGAKVLYYSRSRNEIMEKEGAEFVLLEELFKKSDIVSIHLPMDAPSKIVSRELLNSMKPGTIFVNTSSGHVVDQEALVEILKQGKIKAFLDVFEQFPPRKELKNLPNVIFTYRLGWFTKEALEKKGEILISNIERYLEKSRG